MQIIIDIDEDIYLDMKECNFNFAGELVKRYRSTIASAIISGTPLPNGHGDLKDVNDLLNYAVDVSDSVSYEWKAVYVDDILDAPTIIEADNGGR